MSIGRNITHSALSRGAGLLAASIVAVLLGACGAEPDDLGGAGQGPAGGKADAVYASTLTSGEAVRATKVGGGTVLYAIELSGPRESLKVELTASHGEDFDLYAKLDSIPSVGESATAENAGSFARGASSPETAGKETIDITKPKAGRWYILVDTKEDGGTVELKATLGPRVTVSLQPGETEAFTLTAGEVQRFVFRADFQVQTVYYNLLGRHGNATVKFVITDGLGNSLSYTKTLSSSAESDEWSELSPTDLMWHRHSCGYYGTCDVTYSQSLTVVEGSAEFKLQVAARVAY